MRFSRIRLENWRNFGMVDVPVLNRLFIVGANATGKSNFLDALRFLRDVASPGGGFLDAVQRRGGRQGPHQPDTLSEPVRAVVNLARTSRSAAIREALVPPHGRSAKRGPGYAGQLIRYVSKLKDAWRPAVAVQQSPSLRACIDALKRWA